jgi:SAM-dependent methyltransferase
LGDGKALVHSYHTLHHWDIWLKQNFLGNYLLDAEKKAFTSALIKHFGNQALLIGVPHQYELLTSATKIQTCSLLSPLPSHGNKNIHIESGFEELPILTGSMDLVLLPHTLEHTHSPRQLLAEACRIIKPEGLIGIAGFNPYGIWHLHKKLMNKKMPGSEHFIPAQDIKNWLKLLDFKIEKQLSILYTPPIHNQNFHEKLHFVEKIGQKISSSLGGVYITLARAKVIPLTPIKMKWKQQLNGFRIPTIMSH